MKCFYHPTEDSVQSCSVCRRLLCAPCSHSIKASIYCQDCLVQGAQLARLSFEAGPALVSPKRAALFALIPGMGAVYNRQYTKALVHFAAWMGLWTLAERGPEMFHFAVVSFWIFTMIDAYRSAQEILTRRLSKPASEAQPKPLSLPVWGGLLILLGLLFFLENLDLINFTLAHKFWPLAFVFLGLYLIYSYYREQENKVVPPQPASDDSAPADPAHSGDSTER